MQTVAVFPLLANRASYRPCDNDLLADDEVRAYWLDLFSESFDVQLEAARTTGVSDDAASAARTQFNADLRALRARPDRDGRLDILRLDELRRAALHGHGIFDEFRLVKQRENDAALDILPRRLAELDCLDDALCFDALIHGLLAGNLFDMGVPRMAARYQGRSMPFHEAVDAVPARPWRIDDLDSARAAWLASPPGRSVVFADNAGADFVLGVLPLLREMLRTGGCVLLAANEVPALNDVTGAEARRLLARAASLDPLFAHRRLQTVSSGSASPLLDLTAISNELASASGEADLVVLIGMGRAIESNYTARFTCPCWKIAIIKDPQVARTIGGRLYDAMFRLEPPA